MSVFGKKTPPRDVPQLAKLFGLKKLYIKDESKQRYGTWKDRRSERIVACAQQKGISNVVLISSGNAGYSLGRLGQQAGMAVTVVVDHMLSLSIKRRLVKACTRVLEVDLAKYIFSSRALVRLAKGSSREAFLDVTNGYEEAYESLVDEIRRVRPDYLICPVGSGEAFVGLVRGIKKHRLPTVCIGVAPKKSSRSLADKLCTPWTPYATALQKLTKRKHLLLRVSEAEIAHSLKMAKKYMRCEASSAIVFAGLARVPKGSVVILINSGTSSR